jgi:hypothetical protein
MLFQDEWLQIFVLGPSFCTKTREHIVLQFFSGRGFRDGILASSISWATEEDEQLDPVQIQPSFRYASSALEALGSTVAINQKSLTDCLALGASILTFAIRLRVHDIFNICIQILTLIHPAYITMDPDMPDQLLFLSCILMWEISGCLFSGTTPTLRYQPPKEPQVDRCIGLCLTLLPLMYDICAANQSLLQAEESNIQSTLITLDALEREVQRWQPTISEGFAAQFQQTEIIHMLCQAQVMRLTALLIIYRLRHPFGLNNEPAQVLSVAILTQLEMTALVTKKHVKCVDLALLVACLELQGGKRQEWLAKLTVYAGYSTQFKKHLESILVSFWFAKDVYPSMSWNSLAFFGVFFLRKSDHDIVGFRSSAV